MFQCRISAQPPQFRRENPRDRGASCPEPFAEPPGRRPRRPSGRRNQRRAPAARQVRRRARPVSVTLPEDLIPAVAGAAPGPRPRHRRLVRGAFHLRRPGAARRIRPGRADPRAAGRCPEAHGGCGADPALQRPRPDSRSTTRCRRAISSWRSTMSIALLSPPPTTRSSPTSCRSCVKPAPRATSSSMNATWAGFSLRASSRGEERGVVDLREFTLPSRTARPLHRERRRLDLVSGLASPRKAQAITVLPPRCCAGVELDVRARPGVKPILLRGTRVRRRRAASWPASMPPLGSSTRRRRGCGRTARRGGQGTLRCRPPSSRPGGK